MIDSTKRFLLSKVEYIIIGMLFIIFMIWSISKVGRKEQEKVVRVGDITVINFTLADVRRLELSYLYLMGETHEGVDSTLIAKLEALKEVIKKNEEIQEQDDKKVSE